MSPIIFNVTAGLLILLIIAWFWLIKPKSTMASKEITIYVKDGVYSPSHIETTESNLTLNFIRQDSSPCSEYLLFEQLGVHEQLPTDQTVPIRLTNLKPGEYHFTCQMGMYQGWLIVKELV